MSAGLRARLTYANIVSTVCLFIILGGSAFAATQLSRNSVRSSHIRNGQVKNPDLARDTVTSLKVRDSSLLAADFAPGQLPAGLRGEQGEKGAQGDRGEQGVEGPPGPTAAGVDDASTPPAGATNIESEATITTTRPGKVFGIAIPGGSWSYTCGTGGCSISWGLYVDGVPMTGNTLGSNTGSAITVNSTNGLAFMAKSNATVPAGTHKVSLRYSTGGNFTSVNAGLVRVGALALGE